MRVWGRDCRFCISYSIHNLARCAYLMFIPRPKRGLAEGNILICHVTTKKRCLVSPFTQPANHGDGAVPDSPPAFSHRLRRELTPNQLTNCPPGHLPPLAAEIPCVSFPWGVDGGYVSRPTDDCASGIYMPLFPNDFNDGGAFPGVLT